MSAVSPAAAGKVVTAAEPAGSPASASELAAVRAEFEEQALRVLRLREDYEQNAKRLFALEAKMKDMASVTDTAESAAEGDAELTPAAVSVASAREVLAERATPSVSSTNPAETGKSVPPTSAAAAAGASAGAFVRRAALKQRVFSLGRVSGDGHLLSQTVIVLVRPSGAVNVGQICRTASNLGIADVRLVSPQAPLLTAEGRRYAHHAMPLLAALPTYPTLAAAVADCSLVVGTSGAGGAAALRGARWLPPEGIAAEAHRCGVWDPSAATEDASAEAEAAARAAEEAADAADPLASLDSVGLIELARAQARSTARSAPLARFRARGPRLAVVFGAEADGMTHSELRQCPVLVALPTRGLYPSLNLAHAVTVVMWTLFLTGKPVGWRAAADGSAADGASVPAVTMCVSCSCSSHGHSSQGQGQGQEQEGPVPPAQPSTATVASSDSSSSSSSSSPLGTVAVAAGQGRSRAGAVARPAPRPALERLRVVLEATLHRLRSRMALAAPGSLHEITRRIAAGGPMSEADVGFWVGALGTVNQRMDEVAALLASAGEQGKAIVPPLEVEWFQEVGVAEDAEKRLLARAAEIKAAQASGEDTFWSGAGGKKGKL